MELIVLGSGTSTGVPLIACNCPVCTSTNPKNNRSRCSVYIYYKNLHIVIDTSIDFRQQVLRENIQDLDLVLLTHGHTDHIGGLDDIRPINFIKQKSIDFYASQHAYDCVKKKFDYCFKPIENHIGGGIPQLNLNVINDEVLYKEIKIIPIPYIHGNLTINGYRIGNLAYITDCNYIPDSSYSLLQDLDVLIINAVKIDKHPSHFSFNEALEECRKINARKSYLTHLSHEFEHNEISRILPENVFLTYDGLKIQIHD